MQMPCLGMRGMQARGGMYEVLTVAEAFAKQAGLLQPSGQAGCGSGSACGPDGGKESAVLASARAREVLQRYTVAVGSTGNLGVP